MQEKPDAQLLRAHVQGDESAFREIVSRHTDLVYSAALRQLNSQALAQDIAQSVFVDLVRKSREVSGRMAEDASLAGWLYRSTRFAVLNHLRDEHRRAEHERQAMEQLITDNSPAADWERIRPILDEAMEELSDDDRDALVLRYFKNQDFQTVGRALGLSDDAAQKRVSRAVERLRQFIAKRGVAVGAGGLVVLISANAVQAAPLALPVSISTAATVAGTTIHTSTAIAATKAIAMTTAQKILVAATVAVLAGTGIHEARQNSRLREQNATLQQQQTPLAAQVRQLQTSLAEATNKLSELMAENPRAKSNSPDAELLKLRGEIGVLRAQLAEAKNRKGPEQPPLSTAREYMQRADRHYINHEPEAQLDDLNKAIELDPNIAEAYMERGNLYGYSLPKEQGGAEKALADFSRCLELKPNDSSARWNRAQTYTDLRRYNDAIADWTTYIEGDTDFSLQVDGKAKSLASAHFQRGRVYEAYLHDYSNAIADYTAALQTFPNLEDAHRRRGESYEKLGETEKAQQDFAIEPKRP